MARLSSLLSLLSLVLGASTALAVDYRWTVGYDQGTLEATVDNRNDSSFEIYCPQGQTDTTPGMFIIVKGIEPKAGEKVLVQIVIDGTSHPFELDEIQFLANSRTAKWQFRDLVLSLASSRQKSFVVEFPKYDTSETFSLLDAKKALGIGKESILEGCGESSW